MANEILIRVIGTTAGKQRSRMLKPHIANNALQMREQGYVISDPNYEEKMACFKAKKPYVEGCCKGGVCKTEIQPIFTEVQPATETINTKGTQPEPKKRGRKPKTQIA